MDIKSLMVGDWVIPHIYDSKLEPSKIVGIHYNSYKGKDYVDWVDCEVWDELSLNDIEPIPLTTEILEKNGWIKDGYFYKAEDGSYIQLGELFEHASFRAEKHGIPREIQTSPHLLKYIHQLQHALRLCGIEKEIKL